MRIDRAQSFLLVVDVHAKLAPAVNESERVIANCATLLKAAGRLGVPAVISEHCPQSLGPTIPELLALAPPGAVVTKTHFSCADEPACAGYIEDLYRRQAVIAGMEAHVCVMQTALGLKESGYEVYVAQDACGSRRSVDHAAAMARLQGERIRVVSTEMVLFEWLKRADTPGFKEILELIR